MNKITNVTPSSFHYYYYRPADENVKDVIVTGTFDNWSKTLPLVKTPKGTFELEVPIKTSGDSTKIEFKFVINDSEWVTSDEYWTVIDETGNVNNYIEFGRNGELVKGDKLTAGKTELGKTQLGKTEVGKTIIPESGLSAPVFAEKNAGTNVMPSEEGKQTTLGEPGIVIPENPRELGVFEEVRDVDAKELNAKIKAEEEAKEAEGKETAAAAEEGKPKYVKKVKKLVPKDEAKTEKKEKKGFFSKIKKALS